MIFFFVCFQQTNKKQKMIELWEHLITFDPPISKVTENNYDACVVKLKEHFTQPFATTLEEYANLIEAAEYLESKVCLAVFAKEMASMLSGKSVKEMREMFGIVGDFMPDEESELNKDITWA